MLILQSASFADDPPVIKAPISKCGAKLEYSSTVKSTGQEPAYQLTNLIRNDDNKAVTDLEWSKPDLSASELKAGETLEGTYAISAYDRDTDAPIKFWYQGCKAPAEAYLQKKENPGKSSSLRSLIRRLSNDPKNEIAAAEVIVSKGPEYIQYEITRRPADVVVGLTGVAAWMTSNIILAVDNSAKEYGYAVNLVPAIKVVNNNQLDRLHAEWGKEFALFTRRASSGKDYVRVRLPTSMPDARLTHAKIILVSAEGNLLATGSYATFEPAK